jgi:hypothetical protein
MTTLVYESHLEQKCYARVGFIGNPSDGFQGKTLSFLIKNFCATVVIESNPTIEIVESALFLDFIHLAHQTKTVVSTFIRVSSHSGSYTSSTGLQ